MVQWNITQTQKRIMPFAATWMDLEIIILSKENQKEKDTYHMTSHMWHLKNERIYKTYKQTHIK